MSCGVNRSRILTGEKMDVGASVRKRLGEQILRSIGISHNEDVD